MVPSIAALTIEIANSAIIALILTGAANWTNGIVKLITKKIT